MINEKEQEQSLDLENRSESEPDKKNLVDFFALLVKVDERNNRINGAI